MFSSASVLPAPFPQGLQASEGVKKIVPFGPKHSTYTYFQGFDQSLLSKTPPPLPPPFLPLLLYLHLYFLFLFRYILSFVALAWLTLTKPDLHLPSEFWDYNYVLLSLIKVVNFYIALLNILNFCWPLLTSSFYTSSVPSSFNISSPERLLLYLHEKCILFSSGFRHTPLMATALLPDFSIFLA